ncbi:hypothetical protein [Deinococcus kurensis]|uniref:hypothetical protein n=1 Tax=Deinococcus kurensis TaxID=2662757 RepID=UPI0012D2B69C|nr:hypothetical protein [Deinococcus kurensis]
MKIADITATLRTYAALHVYYSPNQARDGHGRWTSKGQEKAMVDYHADAAAGSKNKADKLRHTATAVAAAAQAAINAGDKGEADKHLSHLQTAVTALRIQAHHARKAGKADEAEARQKAFTHYNGLLKSLKAAHKGGTQHEDVAHYLDGDGASGTMTKSDAATHKAASDAVHADIDDKGLTGEQRTGALALSRGHRLLAQAHEALKDGNGRLARAHVQDAQNEVGGLDPRTLHPDHKGSFELAAKGIKEGLDATADHGWVEDAQPDHIMSQAAMHQKANARYADAASDPDTKAAHQNLSDGYGHLHSAAALLSHMNSGKDGEIKDALKDAHAALSKVDPSKLNRASLGDHQNAVDKYNTLAKGMGAPTLKAPKAPKGKKAPQPTPEPAPEPTPAPEHTGWSLQQAGDKLRAAGHAAEDDSPAQRALLRLADVHHALSEAHGHFKTKNFASAAAHVAIAATRLGGLKVGDIPSAHADAADVAKDAVEHLKGKLKGEGVAVPRQHTNHATDAATHLKLGSQLREDMRADGTPKKVKNQLGKMAAAHINLNMAHRALDNDQRGDARAHLEHAKAALKNVTTNGMTDEQIDAGRAAVKGVKALEERIKAHEATGKPETNYSPTNAAHWASAQRTKEGMDDAHDEDNIPAAHALGQLTTVHHALQEAHRLHADGKGGHRHALLDAHNVLGKIKPQDVPEHLRPELEHARTGLQHLAEATNTTLPGAAPKPTPAPEPEPAPRGKTLNHKQVWDKLQDHREDGDWMNAHHHEAAQHLEHALTAISDGDKAAAGKHISAALVAQDKSRKTADFDDGGENAPAARAEDRELSDLAGHVSRLHSAMEDPAPKPKPAPAPAPATGDAPHTADAHKAAQNRAADLAVKEPGSKASLTQLARAHGALAAVHAGDPAGIHSAARALRQVNRRDVADLHGDHLHAVKSFNALADKHGYTKFPEPPAPGAPAPSTTGSGTPFIKTLADQHGPDKARTLMGALGKGETPYGGTSTTVADHFVHAFNKGFNKLESKKVGSTTRTVLTNPDTGEHYEVGKDAKPFVQTLLQHPDTVTQYRQHNKRGGLELPRGGAPAPEPAPTPEPTPAPKPAKAPKASGQGREHKQFNEATHRELAGLARSGGDDTDAEGNDALADFHAAVKAGDMKAAHQHYGEALMRANMSANSTRRKVDTAPSQALIKGAAHAGKLIGDMPLPRANALYTALHDAGKADPDNKRYGNLQHAMGQVAKSFITPKSAEEAMKSAQKHLDSVDPSTLTDEGRDLHAQAQQIVSDSRNLHGLDGTPAPTPTPPAGGKGKGSKGASKKAAASHLDLAAQHRDAATALAGADQFSPEGATRMHHEFMQRAHGHLDHAQKALDAGDKVEAATHLARASTLRGLIRPKYVKAMGADAPASMRAADKTIGNLTSQVAGVTPAVHTAQERAQAASTAESLNGQIPATRDAGHVGVADTLGHLGRAYGHIASGQPTQALGAAQDALASAKALNGTHPAQRALKEDLTTRAQGIIDHHAKHADHGPVQWTPPEREVDPSLAGDRYKEMHLLSNTTEAQKHLHAAHDALMRGDRDAAQELTSKSKDLLDNAGAAPFPKNYEHYGKGFTQAQIMHREMQAHLDHGTTPTSAPAAPFTPSYNAHIAAHVAAKKTIAALRLKGELAGGDLGRASEAVAQAHLHLADAHNTPDPKLAREAFQKAQEQLASIGNTAGVLAERHGGPLENGVGIAHRDLQPAHAAAIQGVEALQDRLGGPERVSEADHRTAFSIAQRAAQKGFRGKNGPDRKEFAQSLAKVHEHLAAAQAAPDMASRNAHFKEAQQHAQRMSDLGGSRTASDANLRAEYDTARKGLDAATWRNHRDNGTKPAQTPRERHEIAQSKVMRVLMQARAKGDDATFRKGDALKSVHYKLSHIRDSPDFSYGKDDAARDVKELRGKLAQVAEGGVPAALQDHYDHAVRSLNAHSTRYDAEL